MQLSAVQGAKPAPCRAGREAHGLVGEHAVERALGDAVGVLGGVERRAGGNLVEVLRQRAEHEDPVDGVVLIEVVDGGEERLLSYVFRQDDLLHGDAVLLGSLQSAAFICEVVFPLADTEDGETRGDPFGLQGFYTRGRIQIQRVRCRLTFQYCAHLRPP